MKKLLVLSLVLGIASLASAGLDLNTVEGIDYTVDTVAQTVTVTGTVRAFFLSFVPDAGSIEVTSVNSSFASSGVGADPVDLGLTSYPAGSWVTASGSTNSTSSVSGVLFVLSYEGAVSEITLVDETEWYLGNAELNIDGTTVAVAGYTIAVPEPATMALLGLGALVLRRKK